MQQPTPPAMQTETPAPPKRPYLAPVLEVLGEAKELTSQIRPGPSGNVPA